MSVRRFSPRQRAALYLAADGRCERCGIELEPGWHADHIHPYSKSGPTDVINGAALCPSCNHKKGASIMTDPRSRWQHEAESDFFASPARDFLITACPGSGKTRCALSIARTMKDAGQIQRVIVVAPTGRVQQQWKEAAAAYGLDLTTGYAESLPADCDGAVITYQRLAANDLLYRRHMGRVPSLLIADELHRCSDEDGKKWGPALLTAGEPAVRRLLLSGTPFRTDGTQIPFVTYDDNGMAVPDHTVSYGYAVRHQITRPIRFEVMDGRGEWMKGAARFTCQATNAGERERSGLLSALYQPNGKWITTMLGTADDELTRMRDEKPNAGGLIVAQDIATAKEYAKLLQRVCGEVVPVVTSDSDDSNAVIDGYREGMARWIVAVNMISEGVDIPRLSVLVFASKTMTEMWFRQVVGRITRQDGDDITATMFIPALPELVEMAGRIEGEADAGLKAAEEDLRDRIEHEQREIEFDIVVPLSSSDVLRQGVITSGNEFTHAELEAAENLRRQAGGSLRLAHTADVAHLLRLHSGGVPVSSARVKVPETKQTGDDLRRVLRTQVNRLVNRVSRDTLEPYSHIHKRLNRTFGDTLPTASVETLEKRIEVLGSWQ